MSASEKLRALRVPRTPLFSDADEKLWNALPLIADVVEAAEASDEADRLYLGISQEEWSSSQSRALTALQEHLEGK